MSSNERFSDTGSGGSTDDSGGLRDRVTGAFSRLRDRVSGGSDDRTESTDTQPDAEQGAQRAVDRTPEPGDRTAPADPTDDVTTDDSRPSSEDVRQQAVDAEQAATGSDAPTDRTPGRTTQAEQDAIDASVAEVNERVRQQQQGVERGGGRVSSQARGLERRALEQNPNLRRSDIRVRRDGNTLRTELTQTGRRRAGVSRTRDEVATLVAGRNPGIEPGDLDVQRTDDGYDVGLTLDSQFEQVERRAAAQVRRDRRRDAPAIDDVFSTDTLGTSGGRQSELRERTARANEGLSLGTDTLGTEDDVGVSIDDLDRETQERVNRSLIGQRSSQLSAFERRQSRRNQGEQAGDFRLGLGGIGDVADETAEQVDIARREISGARIEDGRLQFGDAPRREMNVLDTDVTLEGITQDAAEGVSAGIESFSRDTAADFDIAGQQIRGAGIRDGRLQLGEGTRPTESELDDSVGAGTLQTVLELGNLPGVARGLDEIAFEPAVETAFGEEVGQTEAGALTIADITQQRAEAAFDRNFAFQTNEQRIDEVSRGNLTGSPEPLFEFDVQPDRREEVAGLAYGGVLSAGVSAGAISGASRLSSGAGRATSIAIQPGEEAAIALARRGLVNDRVARLVPGVRQENIDFGSGPGGPEIRRRSFELDEDSSLDLGFVRGDRGQLELTGRQRQREPPGSDRGGRRRTVSDDFEVTDIDLDRAVRREARVESGPIRVDGETTIPRVPGRRAEVTSGADERQEQAEASSFDIDEEVFGGGIAEEIAQETGTQLDQDQATRPEVRLDLGIETRTDTRAEARQRPETRTELDTRLETRTELDTRQEVRQELDIRQELRQELGLETRTELQSEPFFPEFEDEDDDRRDERRRTTQIDEVFSSGFASGEDLLREITGE